MIEKGPITKSRVWLLAALKAVKRQGWWKEKFALFLMLAMKGREGGFLSKEQSPVLTTSGQEFL